MGFKDMLKRKGAFEEDDDQMYDEGYDEGAYEEENYGGESSFAGGSGGTLELKVVRPEGYDAAPTIADHLLNGRTVVLNLEATSKETARRLIDFLSGIAYSINGSLRRVANNTFVITPNNVDVSGESLKGTASAQASQNTGAGNDFDF